MKKSASVLLVLGAVLLGAACNSPRPAVNPDTGTIVLPDGGARDTGGGGGGDSGGARDTGGGGGSCTLTVAAGNFGSLTSGCFPRCSMATLTAINACTTAACQQGALDADTTGGVSWSVNGMAQTAELDCVGCFANQQLHCFSASGCAAEVDAYVTCAGAGGTPDCNTQLTALNTCGMANQAAIMTCGNSATMGIIACFQM
jgi:hypothetical protein